MLPSAAMLRLKQVLIVLAGLLAGTVMVVLGIWQLDVYRAQGAEAAQARAAEPALPIGQVAPPGAAVRDGYGRSVVVEGRYDPSLQLLLPDPVASGRSRVLTGLKQADGSVVAVVRGSVTGAAPPPPSGPVRQVGVLLPSEDDAPDTGGELDAVRLPRLAQLWPGPLVAGYVTLSAADATAQGLPAAVPHLPEARGRLRNGSYAFQWWLFAGFAVVMAVRMARDLGRDAAEIAPARLGTPT